MAPIPTQGTKPGTVIVLVLVAIPTVWVLLLLEAMCLYGAVNSGLGSGGSALMLALGASPLAVWLLSFRSSLTRNGQTQAALHATAITLPVAVVALVARFVVAMGF